MRHHRPDASELLRTVASHLHALRERLDHGDRYQLIVCGHILDLVAREIEAPPLAEMDEAKLVAEIRTGARDETWGATFDLIMHRTIARLAVVRPEHLAPEHRL
jgi:hypothetical protein